MDMAKTVNLNWLQGQTYRWGFVWARPDAASTPEAPLPAIPRELTGCTARMQIRSRYGAEVLLELTTENGGLTLGPDAGHITIYAADEQTDEVGATEDPLKSRTRARYDLEVIYPSGDVRRVIQGDLTISPNITREVVEA